MVPVGITVEGANILTRTLITFAQGALRSHPYLYQEVLACQDPDEERGPRAVRRGVRRPYRLSLSNVAGAFFHNLTGGLFGEVPERAYGTAEWYRQLWRQSRNFALRRRPERGAARRRPQDAPEAHRPHGRRALRALSPGLRAEALRGRRQAAERPPHRGVRRAQRPLPLPGGAARRDRQLPGARRARADALPRVPVRAPVPAGERPARLGDRAAGDDAGRRARSPDALHPRLATIPTTPRACSRWRSRR